MRARMRISIRRMLCPQNCTRRMRCILYEILGVPANQRTFMRASQALARPLSMRAMRARMRISMRRML